MNRTSDRLFLVTGATGNTGEPTVRLLLERGHRVRAFVRQDDARSESLATAGADVVVGDLLDFHSVSAAMRGVTSAYFVYPIAPGLLDTTVTFAQAASEAGLEAVVNMSQISARRETASNAARQHWLAERLLDRTAMPTARAILENPEPQDRQVYPLHGPIEMSHYEIADAISRALGIPVRYEPVEPAAFADALTGSGFPSHLVQHLRNVAVDYQNGIFAGTNNLIEVIGDRTPMTVEDYVSAHKEDFESHGVAGALLAS